MVDATERERVTAEDAFWAYDDGRIGYEELETLLQWIDAGEEAEACAEWEALGQDPCQKKIVDWLVDWGFRGETGYAISLDSLGHVRNQRMHGSLKLGMFLGEARFKSQGPSDFILEKGRLVLTGRRMTALVGNVSSADIGSAIALQKKLGAVLRRKWKAWQMGILALEDSSVGIHATLGSQKNFQFLGMGSVSVDGFRNAFVRMRSSSSDWQILYSKDWKTPLLYAAARSPRTKNLWGFPMQFRFRVYLHENGSLPGIFRLPTLVQKNRAVANSTIQMRVLDWTFQLYDRFLVPENSGSVRSSVELSFVRKRECSAVGGGIFLNAIGDSLSAQIYMRSGILLFTAESLFTEIRITPQETLYEIRPGVRFEWDKNAFSDMLLIIRGPQRKPLVLRQETRMLFSRQFYGKSGLELRADRLRRLHFWRFGLEFEARW